MTYCKANSCYNSTNYSWDNYCSYHKKCLERLQQSYSEFNTVEKLETFETNFNGNCGWVIVKDSANSSQYWIWLVIYEPAYKSIEESISSIKIGYWQNLSCAIEKAQELKKKLQNSNGWYDYPMLKIHPKENSSEKFENLITSPYVEKKQVGNCYKIIDVPLFFAGYNSSIPSELDRYFKPLDVVWVKCVDRLFGKRFYHVGIYLGDVGNGNRICHFSRGVNGTRLISWDGFLSDTTKKIIRFHSKIPFKNQRRIAEQVSWVIQTRFREDQYCLRNRNCEHLINMLAYGINYSQQIYDNKKIFDATIGIVGGTTAGVMGGMGIFNLVGSIALAPVTGGASLFLGAASTGLVGAGIGLTVEICDKASELNNNKGSTIKLTDEMSESNNKLGEKYDYLSTQIKANIVIPPKENCIIM